MSAKVKEVKTGDGKPYGWKFRCPGCNDWHVLHGWTFNGNLEKPTFSPSVLVHSHEALGDDDKTVITTPRCHSFVTDGRIQFLTDSTHELSGKTVDLPDVC
jgi:hypothetical protein